MRRISARGLVAAIEEEQVIEQAVAAAEPAPVEQLDNAESLETELLEVQDTVEEGVTQEAQVEEAAEVSEALGEYEEALESIAAQGGLDRNGAMILQIGLEQLCARVGIVPTAISMPSMESFGGASQRVRATQLALESVKDTAKKVLEAIIAAIKRAGEWLKDFWKTLTDSNHRLKARAKKVMAAASSAKGEGEIENEGLANKLHIGGKVANFDRDFGEFTAFAEAMGGRVVGAIVKNAETVCKNVADAVAQKGEISFKAADMKAAYNGVKLSAAEGETVEGFENLRSEQLPGGKALLVQLPTADGNAGAQAFGKAKTAIGLFAPSTAKASSAKLPALTSAQVTTIAGSVLSVCEAIDKLRALEAEFDKFVKQMLTSANILLNVKEGEKVGATAVAKGVISSLTTRTANLASSIGSYSLSTSKAALDYCELSMKAAK